MRRQPQPYPERPGVAPTPLDRKAMVGPSSRMSPRYGEYIHIRLYKTVEMTWIWHIRGRFGHFGMLQNKLQDGKDHPSLALKHLRWKPPQSLVGLKLARRTAHNARGFVAGKHDLRNPVWRSQTMPPKYEEEPEGSKDLLGSQLHAKDYVETLARWLCDILP